MRRTNLDKILVLIVCSFLVGLSGSVSASSDWWDSNYQYRQQVTVANNAGSVLESGYTVDMPLDITGLVGDGKAKANGDDVRVVFWDGGSHARIDRILDIGGGEVTFATQADINLSGSDSNYWIYYGNPSAGAPPDNASNVYVFYDDFEGSSLDITKWKFHDNHQYGINYVSVAGSIMTLDGDAAYADYIYATIRMGTRQSFIPPVILEMYHKYETGPESHHKWFGFGNIDLSRRVGAYIHQTANKAQAIDDESNTVVDTNWSPGLYTIKKFLWDDETPEFRWYENDVEKVNSSITTNIYVQALPIHFDIDVPYNQYVDWVLVRKYVPSEPSTSLGGEEDLRIVILEERITALEGKVGPLESTVTTLKDFVKKIYDVLPEGWKTKMGPWPF